MFEIYRPSSEPPAPCDVYPSSLFCLGLGYALWYPEPHDTGEPQIGDIGYVSDGAFIRIFNLNQAKSEHKVPVGCWHKPFENTEAIPEEVFRPDRRHRPISDGPFVSRGVVKRETRGSIST